MKIAITGIGYVGLSNAMLLSQNHEVIALGVVPEKIEQLNNKISPIHDVEIEDTLANINPQQFGVKNEQTLAEIASKHNIFPQNPANFKL